MGKMKELWAQQQEDLQNEANESAEAYMDRVETKEERIMKQELVETTLHGIIESLCKHYRGYLPHENAPGEFHSSNRNLSADTRTRLAFIEDCLKKADDLVDRVETLTPPSRLKR